MPRAHGAKTNLINALGRIRRFPDAMWRKIVDLVLLANSKILKYSEAEKERNVLYDPAD